MFKFLIKLFRKNVNVSEEFKLTCNEAVNIIPEPLQVITGTLNVMQVIKGKMRVKEWDVIEALTLIKSGECSFSGDNLIRLGFGLTVNKDNEFYFIQTDEDRLVSMLKSKDLIEWIVENN